MSYFRFTTTKQLAEMTWEGNTYFGSQFPRVLVHYHWAGMVEPLVHGLQEPGADADLITGDQEAESTTKPRGTALTLVTYSCLPCLTS